MSEINAGVRKYPTKKIALSMMEEGRLFEEERLRSVSSKYLRNVFSMMEKSFYTELSGACEPVLPGRVQWGRSDGDGFRFCSLPD